MSIRSSVRPSQNVWSCTPKKRLDIDAPIYANLFKMAVFVRQQIFIEIVNVFDLNFRDQKFESRAFRSSHMTVLPTMADNCQDIRSRMWPFNLHICILTLGHFKGQGQGHISTANISKMVMDRENIAIISKYKVSYVLSVGMFCI